jgi:hypothetical protein
VSGAMSEQNRRADDLDVSYGRLEPV